MMGQLEHHCPSLGSTQAVHFGAFLKVLRHGYGIKQVQVLAALPGWTQTSYSRLESDELAPAFDQLAALYAALHLAGVQFTPFDEKAIVEAQRYAKAGDALSCEEFWIYQVNHGRLCLRLGRIDEAERIFSGGLTPYS